LRARHVHAPPRRVQRRGNRGEVHRAQSISGQQAKFCVYNSLLSEAAVLGFDYGYSLDYPDMLCIWEAQFGDFVNGAQVVHRPVHRRRRIEVAAHQRHHPAPAARLRGPGPRALLRPPRALPAACAEDNIQVANLTTPAQLFHVLRRQMKREFKKPLIIMSPKSLLRHPAAVSKLDDFTKGSFQEIIDDPIPAKKAERVILCSGKVYYDLVDYREKNKVKDTAIIRVEQLYPLHRDRLAELADDYGRNARLIWCQEEPQNMGAWSYIAPSLEEIFGRKAIFAGREAAASPAVGLLALHRQQLATFLKKAFTL
jgi:2-oxoglutarate dehydrogenase E1 component